MSMADDTSIVGGVPSNHPVFVTSLRTAHSRWYLYVTILASPNEWPTDATKRHACLNLATEAAQPRPYGQMTTMTTFFIVSSAQRR